MSRIDLYPQLDSRPSEAQIATGTQSGEKMGLDTHLIGGTVTIGTAAVPADYDSGEVSYPSTTQEIYIYRKAGNIVRTVTINYTSATKDYIADWSIL